tara:strand:- start:1653 stop:2363 length:711 start_codon:yes stop_codon:yes gene_type:complete
MNDNDPYTNPPPVVMTEQGPVSVSPQLAQMSMSNYTNATNSLVDSIMGMAQMTKGQEVSQKQSQIMGAIDKVVSFEDPGSQEVLKNLLTMTAHMENSMGGDSSAYGREYTNSFMSIDSTTFDNIFDPKGNVDEQGNWVREPSDSQNKWKVRYGELGLPSEKNAILALLKSDDPQASIAVARNAYANIEDPLPLTSDPKTLYNYYKKLYNRGGQDKYGNDADNYKRFLEGYNKYIKQ